MAGNILITGATGLIGTQLVTLLEQKGYRVSVLSRRPARNRSSVFVWDVDRGMIDVNAIRDVDTIVHLAGAGIADKRWTQKRKKEIADSRIRSTSLLQKVLSENPHNVKQFISASAIGYYGFDTGTRVLPEEAGAGNDFLASVTSAWEEAVDQISKSGIRVVKLRTGIVLSRMGGALPTIARPIRWGVGAPIGSGKQMMSWIHEQDLCNLYIKAIEDNNFSGAYNAVSPHPVTNAEFNKVLARRLRRPLWLPAIPGWVLKAVLGEMANLVIGGNHVSADKVLNAGFQFLYPHLADAFDNLYPPKQQ